ncbi:hypothetical protein M8C21_022929 [Ambrosia artemisiifolia]|uniref:Nucleoside diphosphate kinase-like domain-containing protein n=1 Tax=Ambrosia artemisiifolia TaxID=4212 RepID=A0AAD5G3G4_AMBAR|nr:hypothetical protein M8C21_022929 [Ambrosia artemisiifolia]
MHMNLRFGSLCILITIILLPSLAFRALAAAELTLAIVKPDGISGNHTSSIRNIILQSGFTIHTQATLHLHQHTVTAFYAEHSTKTFFPSLVKYMTSGPVLIMVLEKVNAIADWRTLIGPTDARKAKITHPDSIRAMCGEDLERNCVHGSDSHESAAREISFFFPDSLSGEISLPES